MITTGGTTIEVRRLDPALSFSAPLLHTYEESPGHRPTVTPHSFESAGEVVFSWEIVAEGTQEAFQVPPDAPIELAIYRVENAPAGAPAAGAIRDAIIENRPVTTAKIDPNAPHSAELLSHFDLDDLAEVLSGTFVIEARAAWGDRVRISRAAFSVPLPRLTLLNITNGGTSEKNRRNLRQGDDAAIRFFNTHAGWPKTDYVAQIDGDTLRKLSVENELVDLSRLKAGDYSVNIQFRYRPDLDRVDQGIPAAATTAFVRIRENRWMYYLLGALAAATIGVFAVNYFTSKT